MTFIEAGEYVDRMSGDGVWLDGYLPIKLSMELTLQIREIVFSG